MLKKLTGRLSVCLWILLQFPLNASAFLGDLVTIRANYESAQTGEVLEVGSKSVIPLAKAGTPVASDPRMFKTAALIQIAQAIQAALYSTPFSRRRRRACVAV